MPRLTDTEYRAQGTNWLEANTAKVEAIIAMLPEPKRTQVAALMAGHYGEAFMTAPASTRRMFHYAFDCGLVAHSLNVVRNTLKVAEALYPGRWPTWKLAFVALFHDFGKCDFYEPTRETWKEKKGEFYDVKTSGVFMPNAEKSVWLLQNQGVILDADEAQAIRLNDGMGPAENKGYSFREDLLSLVVHTADHHAMRQEKLEDAE